MLITERIKQHILFNLKISESAYNFYLTNGKLKSGADEEEILEKTSILKTYYGFVSEPTCVEFIEKAYNQLKNLTKNEKKFFFLLNDENDDPLFTGVIIILKSFIDAKGPGKGGTRVFANSTDLTNYCVENFLNYALTREVRIDEKVVRQLFILFFSILKEADLLKEQKIKFQGLNVYKTFVFYDFHTIHYKLSNEELLNFVYAKFRLFEYDSTLFIKTFHFSRFFKICKKNFYSNKVFRPKNLSYLTDKINLPIYIDKENIKEKFKYDNKNDLEEKITSVIKKLKNLYHMKDWTVDTKVKIAEVQQEYSNLMEIKTLIAFLEHPDLTSPIYFPIYMDFRGRKYYDSPVGPTQSKLLRTVYFYGYYERDEIAQKKPTEELVTYSGKIKEICENNGFEFKDCFYDAIYWCFIGIGKNLVDKTKVPITELDFFLSVEDFLKNQKKYKLKLVDECEVHHYIKILRSLTTENMNNGKIKKHIVIKDATASVNQILMKKLGPLNQEAMNYVNLGKKNEWYDTYMIHKIKFAEDSLTKYEPEYVNRFLKRSWIKKIIMIVPYSAGFDLCWKEFVEQVKEEQPDIEINYDLRKLIENFYYFVKKTMQEKYLYKKSSANFFAKIVQEFEEQRKFILESETGEADISYYKMKKTSVEKRYKFENKQKRVSKLIWEVTDSPDIRTFSSATGPNFAHFYDADEIREIELSMKRVFMTVHDSYLVDVFSCTDLIKAKQHHYSKHIPGFEIKNFFISI